MGRRKRNPEGLGAWRGRTWAGRALTHRTGIRRDPTSPGASASRSGQVVRSYFSNKAVRIGHSTVIPATKGELLSIADSISMDRTSKWGLGFFQVCK